MISSSGIIKRGLAATAISALAVTGVPALAGTAHAAVDTVTVAGFSAFDLDEFASVDDFTVTVKDGATLVAGQAVEYSFVRTPEGGVADPATPYVAGGLTGADGTVKLTFAPAGLGSYTLNVRTVGSHIPAAPFTFVVGESEITWADGASASSPVNGSDTYTATLALTNAAKTPLPQRAINVTYNNGGGEAVVTSPQTAPTVRVNDSAATSTTGADGKFTVSLTDPALPAGTPESGTLTAVAPEPSAGDIDPAADAKADLAVNFAPTAVVKSVELDTKNVFAGVPAPGKPVELNVVVKSEGATPAPGDDVVLKDYPVSVTVDKGFLTPDTQGAGLNVGEDELALTADQDDEGDLFGFYENLGADETVDTSDNAGTDAAGIVATIEKDAGFNDDGLVKQTVTVTAGGKSATAAIDYDVRNYLNLTAAAFRRDGGSTTVPGSIDLKLYAVDQFANLVGDQPASISDNTPAARVVEEAGGADTDFVNDNPAATASSTQKVTQTVNAAIQAVKTLVGKTNNPVSSTETVNASHIINWGAGGGTGGGDGFAKVDATLIGSQKGNLDRLKIKTNPKVARGQIRLFKRVGNKPRVLIGAKRANDNGVKIFLKPDRNGNAVTKYFAIVSKNKAQQTRQARTNNERLR